jgi:hypothetical protein
MLARAAAGYQDPFVAGKSPGLPRKLNICGPSRWGTMLYDKLWEIAVRADWRLTTVEYKALAVGAFVVAAVLVWNRIRIWKRIWMIETQLKQMQREIDIVEMQESRRLIMELNANSKVEIDRRDTAIEMSGGRP